MSCNEALIMVLMNAQVLGFSMLCVVEIPFHLIKLSRSQLTYENLNNVSKVTFDQLRTSTLKS